jgi:hypothetical protein
VGENQAAIENSYATGSVGGNISSTAIGGLVGNNVGTIGESYSTGTVRDTGTYVGGLIGVDGMPAGNITDSYWDTDTSGIKSLSQGAGIPANDPGVTGLTTAQFQSGLPAGFDPNIWAENPNINGGLPYLLANPPVK